MFAVSDAVSAILPYAAGIPEPAIEDAIRVVAEDICRRAHVWNFEDEFTVAEAQDSLAAPYAAHILRVYTCTVDDRPIEPTTERQLDARDQGWRTRGVGDPRFYWQRAENEIVLTPAPQNPVKVKVEMVLTTTIDSEFLPGVFRYSHRRLLIDGVVAELLTMPGKTWTNVEAAAIRNSRFQAGVLTAAYQKQRGQQGARFRSKASYV